MAYVRRTIDSTLMAIAHVWADRSTCSRGSVGSVIALDGRHIGSGYNGAPAGMPHCEHQVLTIDFSPNPTTDRIPFPNPLEKGCPRSIHAETNAIAYCARHGVCIEGATIYTTMSPCFACSQLILAAGLIRVVYNTKYRDPAGINLLQSAGLIVDRLTR